jgi:hypothetical protein
MQAQADRVKPFAQWLEPFRSLPLVLLSLFIMVGAVDLLLAVQPALLQAMRGSWQDWTLSHGIAAPWASLLAAAGSVAGVAVASAILATFLRGVQSEPFLWLAPAWVGLCFFVLARMPIALPLPLSMQLFASTAALTVVGGASFLQQRSPLRTFTATLLLVTPIALLCAGYLGQFNAGGARPNFDAAARFAMFVLVVATAGAAAIAVACGRGLQAGAAGSGELASQVLELLERVKFSETRANEAEQQLRQARGMGRTLALSEDDAAFARLPAHSARQWPLWAALAFVLGCGASLYFASYLPLRGRLSAEISRNRRQNAEQAQSLASLRAHFDEERAALLQQLSAARAQPASEPSVAPMEPSAAPPAPRAVPPRVAKTQAHAPASHRSSSAKSHHASREAAEANDEAPAKAPERAAPAIKPEPNPAGDSTSNDPLEGLDGM